MRKWGALAIGGVLLITLATPVNAAAPKAGATCTKKNATATSAGKLYTCILSGKKLVWNKGVAVPKPTPSPTKPTAIGDPIGAVGSTPSPTPTPTPTPTPSFTPPKEPKSFAEIEENYEGVIYWAWKKSKDKIESSKSSIGFFESIIGPNSGILNKNPLIAYETTSRLYAGYEQGSKLYSISYSFDDVKWAQTKFEDLFADPELLRVLQSPNRGGPNQALNICPSPERCHSSTPNTNRSGVSIILVGYTPTRTNYLGETNGDLQSHEYTHVVQQSQFIGTAREINGLASTKEFMPWWLIEGGADFGGLASTYYQSFASYSEARLRDVNSVKKRDATWFASFIDPASNQEWIQYDSTGEIYNVGFMITEIFTALKGPDSQMEIAKQIARGKTMDEAFENVFGTPWKSAVPIIARVLANVRAKG